MVYFKYFGYGFIIGLVYMYNYNTTTLFSFAFSTPSRYTVKLMTMHAFTTY